MLRVETFDYNIFDYYTKGDFFHPFLSRTDNSGRLYRHSSNLFFYLF